jgi:hypothetical protein
MKQYDASVLLSGNACLSDLCTPRGGLNSLSHWLYALMRRKCMGVFENNAMLSGYTLGAGLLSIPPRHTQLQFC